MSPHDPDPHDPDPREDRVRALLAGLPAETTPPDVAARLDDTVDRLARERSADVPSLAARRERAGARHRVPRVAVAAAAAVAVLGGAAVAAQQDLAGGGSADSSAAGRAEAPASATPGAPASGTDGSGSAGVAPPSASGSSASTVPTLSSATFARDVTALLDDATQEADPTPGPPSGPTGPGSTSSSGPSDGAGSGARLAPGEDQGRDLARNQDAPSHSSEPDGPAPLPESAFESGSADPGTPACTPPRTAPSARTQPVTLDGRPAVLVVGPVLDGTRTVSAWPCGSRTPAATAQVPAGR